MKDTQHEKAARSILRQFSRSSLEVNASEIILYERFKEDIATFAFEEMHKMQLECMKELQDKTDEDLRKMIFEHDFPGHIWRRKHA